MAVFGEPSEAVAALSVSLPKVRVLGPEHEFELAEKLKALAAQIAAEMQDGQPRIRSR